MSSSIRSLRHRSFAVLAAASLSLASGCGSDVSTAPTEDVATHAVNVFTQLADSVSRAGGDADVGGAYASLAEAIRQGGRVSPVVITVDGVPTTFLATAHQMEMGMGTCLSQLCAAMMKQITLRTLIAWQQDDPRRVIQLSSEADSVPIRAYLYPVLVPYAGPSASFVYIDGKGGTYFGTSGSQKLAMTPTNTACATAGPPRAGTTILPAPPRCTQAGFSVTFTTKAEPSTFLSSRNTATGTHTLSMAAQSVLGSRFELLAMGPPQPPVRVTPSASLPATLTAKVDNLVTLTLTVSNTTGAPVTISMGGQAYDFTIYDATTGAPLWQWSNGKAFTMALVSKTVPANGSLVFSEAWKPTQKGALVAVGSLVSMSHRADAKLQLSVP